MVNWTVDGQSLLVSQFRNIPAPVEKLDLQTGRRSFVPALVPADRAGVLVVTNASFSDGTKSYACSYVRLPSRLAVCEGREMKSSAARVRKIMFSLDKDLHGCRQTGN